MQENTQAYTLENTAALTSENTQALTAGRQDRRHNLPRITRTPRFLSALESHRFSSAESGTIMHTVMQQIDVAGALDR
ncbi:hypothetical protein MXD63_42680, partial [Frankia sp. Cpl3]|nr:hypothetical protein [Frankia sp. Cpl3]